MVNLPGRDRRRRVLKDEVLSASTNYNRLQLSVGVPEVAPRYSDAAGVENHPQITDFIPRRYATIAMLIVIGASVTTILAAIDYFAPLIASMLGVRDTAAFEIAGHNSIGAWIAAVVLLVTSVTCLITHSIRRHRIDDIRGRFRIWFLAATVSLVVSANSVAPGHQILADVLGHFTGWSALRGGAIWWLVLAGLPIGWVIVRCLIDVRECRVATVFLASAAVCYVASAAVFVGIAGLADARICAIIVGATLLIGHWLTLAAAVSYGRFVVLDAQGLIAVRRRASKKTEKAEAKKAAAPATVVNKPAVAAASNTSSSRQPIQVAETPADSKRWVDGSRPERDRYDGDEDDDETSDSDRKLSKSDRKRLRKLKTQGRAA